MSLGQAAEIISRFHDSIGWDAVVSDVTPSAPLSAGTWDEIVSIAASSLINSGLSVERREVLGWHEHLGDIHSEDQPLIKNLPRFLRYFQYHGVMIAICTSDDRPSTDACMRNWEITDLVDHSICGDEVEQGKPSPQPLMELCRRAGVLPSECVVVGDTTSDTLMGARAGASLVVGVLTGSGTKEQLLESAHVVLASIRYLKDYLLLRRGPSGSMLDHDEGLDERQSPIKVRAG